MREEMLKQVTVVAYVTEAKAEGVLDIVTCSQSASRPDLSHTHSLSSYNIAILFYYLLHPSLPASLMFRIRRRPYLHSFPSRLSQCITSAPRLCHSSRHAHLSGLRIRSLHLRRSSSPTNSPHATPSYTSADHHCCHPHVTVSLVSATSSL
eukprot:SAG11_NODE_9046_length_949_cov_1.934118_3_plen_151_part_00